jgi:uroporphyrinogen-III synthase
MNALGSPRTSTPAASRRRSGRAAASGTKRAPAPAKPRAVVVTRDEPTDGPLSSELRALGLSVLSWPVVRVGEPEDCGPLEQALAHASKFDWIVFASRHAVRAVTSRLRIAPVGVRIAAVGASTAESLRAQGWRTHVVPSEASAAALVAALAPMMEHGTRVLFPASSRALPTLAAGLSQLGVAVTQVEAYRAESAPLDPKECRAWIGRGAIAAVTFTSPSTVVELERALGRASFERLLASCAAVALGATTGQALGARGHTCTLAEPASLSGLAVTTFRLLQPRS